MIARNRFKYWFNTENLINTKEREIDLNRHEIFYRNARTVSTEDYDSMIAEYVKDAKEDDYNWYDFNTAYEDVTLDCVIDYFSEVTEDDFSNLFGYSKANKCYIVKNAGIIDFYSIITKG